MNRAAAARFRANLRIERDNAALYTRLAALAGDARSSHVYRRIAAGERVNARFWEERLRALGVPIPPTQIGLRVRTLSWFARRFGTEFVCRRWCAWTTPIMPPRRWIVAGIAITSSSPTPGRCRAIGIARSVAIPCAQPCSGPTTGWCPMSAW
jgi:hypothetical protein